jgi:mono/diheme cytochrome c family protein
MRTLRSTLRSAVAVAAAVATLATASGAALATTPADILAIYTAKSGAPASPERGQAMFMRKFGRDFENCAACHTADPTKAGRDLVQEKEIEPLAPAANGRRFTTPDKVESAFRLNCKDVVGRECTAGEKADILSWLISLKR